VTEGERGRGSRPRDVRVYRSPGRRRASRAAGLARLSVLLVVVVSVLVTGFALAGALAGTSGGTRRAASGVSAGAAGSVRVYFTSGEQLVSALRPAPSAEDRVAAAIRALLAGPTASERRSSLDSAVPSGTRLRSVEIDHGTAKIVLDAGFAAASPDAASVADPARSAALAQVTFTATAVLGIHQVLVAAPGMKTLLLSRADFLGPGSAPAPTPTLSGSVPGSIAAASATSAQSGASPVADPFAPSATASSSAEPAGSAATPTPIGSAATPAAVAAIKPKNARQVQEALVRLRYLPLDAVTGAFDYRTSQAAMAFQSWVGLQRDGIVGKQTARMLQVAQPPAPTRQGTGRWVEIYRAQGTLLLVRDGAVVQAVHCSTGRTMDAPPYDTPAGSYTVFAKMIKSWSVPYKVWMPYAAYFHGGIAMHGLDYVPAYPASHGCVRVSMPEAPTVFAFVSVGTPVYVF
jgi:lipoprotein-anchoring transpeptidase ErfK/SrfK